VFDREIPQVLLLHANSLNADYLDILLDLLEDRGYRFVGLSEAVSDPAYDRPDTYVGPRGLSWIQRWALAADVHVPDEPREAEWVAEALHAIQTGSDQQGTSQSTGNEGDGAVDGSRQQQVSATEAIAAASRAFSAAFVAGDTAAIRELYTEGAMLLPPERDVRGRDAIARYFAPGPRRRNLEHAMTSDDLGIEGNLAVDMGTWTNRWSLDGGEPRQASGRYLIVWRRGEDDRWRIEYDMWHRPTSR
jgi:ketosteroid isomerase-like protein